MRLLHLTFAAMLLLLASAVTAQTTNPLEYAPADSDVAMVVNLSRMLASESVVRKALDRVQKDPQHARMLDSRIKMFQNITGINPFVHLQSVALWGKVGDPDSFGIQVRGQFDQQKLLTLLQMNSGFEFTSEVQGLQPLFRWKEKGEKTGVKYGTFVGDGSVLVFNSLATVQKSVEAKQQGKTWASEVPGDFAMWAQLKKPGEGSARFKDTMQIATATYTLQMKEFEVESLLKIQAASPQAAQDWLDILQGAKAFAKLQSSNVNLQKMAESSSAELTPGSNEVIGRLALSNEAILTRLDSIIAKHSSRRD